MGWAKGFWAKAKASYQKAKELYRKGKEIYRRVRDRYRAGRADWQRGRTAMGVSRGTVASVLLFGAAMVGAFLGDPSSGDPATRPRPAAVAEARPRGSEARAGELTGAGRRVMVATRQRRPGSAPAVGERRPMGEAGQDRGREEDEEVVERGLPTGGA